ncbi:trypsin-like serine protease [Xanthomonas citri]|uniref:trypsin-like serine protease n=1 Tax=Xanthomonas citri TaxID=346 RepID=UPI001E5D4F55|nr:trypsin-like serine protease [Xanthomonas citri]WPM74888.1 S1 family peptidase [Xanthomonas citri pv. viticola]
MSIFLHVGNRARSGSADAAQSLKKVANVQRRAAMLAMAVVVTLVSAGTAAQTPGVVQPRNPDRGVLPVISGSKVSVPFGSCTVGAVLVPTSIFHRLTPYQRATRWIVLAKHCAPLYASIHVGTAAIGNVVWQSATSDIELVRVSPQPDPATALYCASHGSAVFCNPIQSYVPRANNQVFMPRAGREARLAVSGWANAPDGQFCTSGWRTGVRCVWQGMSLVQGIPRPSYQHIDAAHGSELNSIDNGDSGGPVVTYDRHLIGIISSGEPGGRSIVYYTPMQQVLHELYSYSLAPADLPTAAGDDNPLSPGGENAGWELAPTDG